MTMTKTLRDCIREALRRPPHEPYRGDPFAPAAPAQRPGLTCRCCESRATVELTPDEGDGDSELREFLCWGCLVTFVTTFADPRVRVWVVTKL